MQELKAIESATAVIGNVHLVYPKAEADKVIEELKDKVQMHDFFWDGCGFAKRGWKNTIQVAEHIDNIEQENEKLKAELAAIKEERRWRKCSDELPKAPEG